MGAVIQRRKAGGETWPGDHRHAQAAKSRKRGPARASTGCTGVPSSKPPGSRSAKGASKDWRPGFLEEVGLEKGVEPKDSGVSAFQAEHSISKGPEVRMKSGRKWLRAVRVWIGRSGSLGHRESYSPREIERVTDSRGLANEEIERHTTLAPHLHRK